MTDISSTKEIIKRATLGIRKGILTLEVTF